MLPVLNAAQLRQADEATIMAEGIASIDLMERAARRCADWLLAHYPEERAIGFTVLGGTGNNGGDGLAIARMLHLVGRKVTVVLCKNRPQLSPDAQVNRDRLVASGIDPAELEPGSALPRIAEGQVVLDALFGTGLDRPITGWPRELIMELNSRRCEVVSIDMPSGLFCEDNSANDVAAIVRATHVLTFEVPKLDLLLPENAPFAQRWHRLSIGLDRAFINGLASQLVLLEWKDIAACLPAHDRAAHKGDHGHALIMAGSTGKMGAAVLAARAAARSGCGRLTVHVPGSQAEVMHTSIPEAMLSQDGSVDLISTLPELAGFSTVGVGPGMGVAEETARVLKLLIQEARAPLVLDADALNILAENKTWLAFLPNASILTPHPKEFDRLAGGSASGYDRLQRAREFAARFGVVLVLKGAHTAICSPDGRVFFNPTGNPGMAKGGSGDALTGVITGLLAQGVRPLEAAIAGVFAHGLAGDIAADDLGMDGMLPSDLIERLPLAWMRIRAYT